MTTRLTGAKRAWPTTTWSDGKMPSTVSGEICSTIMAASAHAGAAFCSQAHAECDRWAHSG